jgi:hypothetical protein
MEMFGTNCDSLKRDVEYYRDELDREREYAREREEREYEKREALKRERQQAYQESLCYADSWEDAFEKGLARIGRELAEERKFAKEFPDWEPDADGFWVRRVEAIEKAQSIYRRERLAMQSEIAKLEESLLNRVANELAQEFPDIDLVESLRTNDYQSLVAW